MSIEAIGWLRANVRRLWRRSGSIDAHRREHVADEQVGEVERRGGDHVGDRRDVGQGAGEQPRDRAVPLLPRRRRDAVAVEHAEDVVGMDRRVVHGDRRAHRVAEQDHAVDARGALGCARSRRSGGPS